MNKYTGMMKKLAVFMMVSFFVVCISPTCSFIAMDKHKVNKKGWTGMGHIFLFLVGFGMAVAGGVTLIAYTNFLPAGISWFAYFDFIKDRMEVYFLPIGILLMAFVIYRFPNKP